MKLGVNCVAGISTYVALQERGWSRPLRDLGTRFVMVALCNRGPLWFCPVISIVYRLSIFFSSPDLSGRRLDVYHTLAHGVALVRI